MLFGLGFVKTVTQMQSDVNTKSGSNKQQNTYPYANRKDRPSDLVTFYDIQPGNEQIYPYNPGAHTGKSLIINLSIS